MGIMVSEVYEAFIAAGAPEAKAKAAAEAIPVTEHLATKQDIAVLRQEVAGVEAMVGRVESELKGSIAAGDSELKQEIGRLESELKGSIAAGDSELKQEIGRLEARFAALEAKMWRAGLAIAGSAVLLNRFLDWISR